MRQYQPIWEAIKTSPDRTRSISADPKLHARIIKAVRKEKNMDLGWKHLLLIEGVKYKLQETSEGSLLTFELIDVSPITTAHL